MGKGTTDFSAQRPAINISLPAVTRHVTYRIPKAANPRLYEDRNEVQTPDWEEYHRRHEEVLWEALLGSLSAHVAKIQMAAGCTEPLWVRFKVPGHSEPYPRQGPAGRHETRNISKSAVIRPDLPADSGFRLRLRIDVYNEIVGITYIFDEIADGAATLPRRLGQAIKLVSKPDLPTAGQRARQGRELDYLYEGFWSRKSGLGAAIDRGPTGRAFKEARLLDFRGVYLECAAVEPTGSGAADKPGKRERVANWSDPLRKFAEARTLLIDHAIGVSDDRRDPERGGEPVFCTMLNGDALYLAELGRTNEDQIEPLRHMLVFAEAPPSQVGRLVRRLHVMGELRHAALLDYDNGDDDGLKEVSRHLRQIGPEIDRVLREESGQSANKKKQAVDLSPAHPLRPIGDVIQRVAWLRANKDDDGVTYRVQQSRYYAEQFRKGLKHLRTGRIRRYQSYDDFVSRYIFQAFARIDGIGKRYEAMLRRLNLAATYKTAVEINSYQADTKLTLKAVQMAAEQQNALLHSVRGAADQHNQLLAEVQITTKQQNALLEIVKRAAGQHNRLLRNVQNTTNQQRDLLETAEKIAIIVLVYYCGSGLHTILKDLYDRSDHIRALSRNIESVHFFLDAAWAVALITVFGLFLSFQRKSKRKRRDQDPLPSRAKRWLRVGILARNPPESEAKPVELPRTGRSKP